MTTMQDAFARLGYRPPERLRPSVKMHRVDSAPDYGAFSDDDLAAEIRALEEARIVITEEINADAASPEPRGMTWRQAAGKARAYKVAHLKLARDEYERRHPPAEAKHAAKAAAHEAWAEATKAVADARAREKEARTAEHKASAEAAIARRDAAKAEADAVWQKRAARRARLFLMAADHLLSKEERAWIWNAARKKFPNDPVWDAGDNWGGKIT